MLSLQAEDPLRNSVLESRTLKAPGLGRCLLKAESGLGISVGGGLLMLPTPLLLVGLLFRAVFFFPSPEPL